MSFAGSCVTHGSSWFCAGQGALTQRQAPRSLSFLLLCCPTGCGGKSCTWRSVWSFCYCRRLSISFLNKTEEKQKIQSVLHFKAGLVACLCCCRDLKIIGTCFGKFTFICYLFNYFKWQSFALLFLLTCKQNRSTQPFGYFCFLHCPYSSTAAGESLKQQLFAEGKGPKHQALGIPCNQAWKCHELISTCICSRWCHQWPVLGGGPPVRIQDGVKLVG